MRDAFDFDGIFNFRDLGGLATTTHQRVRSGRVFRSAHLAGASERDLRTLRSLGVCLVLDLRTDADIGYDGVDRLPAGAVWRNVPLSEDGLQADPRDLFSADRAAEIRAAFPPGEAHKLMVSVYAEMATSPFRTAQAATAVRAILHCDGAVLFHCSGGKDRTGWLSAIIHLAVGVPVSTVIDDYLLTNTRPQPSVARILDELAAAGVPPRLIKPLMYAHRDYIQAAIDAVEAKWDGFDGYLRDGLELGSHELRELRERLIDG